MRREILTSDYEEFEPDIPVWPYVTLSFLIPLVPFVLTILLGDGFGVPLVLRFFSSLLPLLCTASIIRSGEKTGMLNISAGLYAAFELMAWTLERMDGLSSGLPLGLLMAPALLPVLAYTFFQKRRHGKWLGTMLLSLLLLLVASFFIHRYGENDLYLIYPSILLVLTLMMVFVTRRTEGTPILVLLLLVLNILSSVFFTPGTGEMMKGEGGNIVDLILATFSGNQQFWYSILTLFVFSGLAMKSSYRHRFEEVGEYGAGAPSDGYDDQSLGEEKPWTPAPREVRGTTGTMPGYTYPPEYSRFGEEPQRPVVPREPEPSIKEEAKEEPRIPRSPDYESQYRDKSSNDKWYEFISGGVTEEPKREERREAPRDSYRDSYRGEPRDERPRYRDDRDRYYDERDRYPEDRRRYDDRRYEEDYPQRRYDDDRAYRRDDRDRYYDERDRRYSDERRRDYYDRIMDDRDRDDRPRRYEDDRDPRRP